jgi:hypothetical protein
MAEPDVPQKSPVENRLLLRLQILREPAALRRLSQQVISIFR